jgi:hypothetical protein
MRSLARARFIITHFETILLYSERMGVVLFLNAFAPLIALEEDTQADRASALRACVTADHPLMLLQLFATLGGKS